MVSKNSKACVGGLVATLALSGCDLQATPPPGERPATVEVPAGRVALGFATGVLRSEEEVSAFAIGTYPVTVAQYAACVEAGACPEVDCLAASPAAENPQARRPLACATYRSATAYCNWVGGTLPTLSQWLYAARGSDPQRYPWGAERPTCQQHPWAGANLAARTHLAEAKVGRGAPKCPHSGASLAVSTHPAGASAFGLQDVLLTAGELTQPAAEDFGACDDTASAGCVIYGLEGGALDAVTARVEDRAAASVGFRCVWEG